MTNIKLIATAVAAAGVAGMTALIHLTRTRADVVESAADIVLTADSDFEAFDRAQTEISKRIMTGYYDGKTDRDIRHDFDVIHANYQKK